jgi:hypothetical protein
LIVPVSPNLAQQRHSSIYEPDYLEVCYLGKVIRISLINKINSYWYRYVAA